MVAAVGFGHGHYSVLSFVLFQTDAICLQHNTPQGDAALLENNGINLSEPEITDNSDIHNWLIGAVNGELYAHAVLFLANGNTRFKLYRIWQFC